MLQEIRKPRRNIEKTKRQQKKTWNWVEPGKKPTIQKANNIQGLRDSPRFLSWTQSENQPKKSPKGYQGTMYRDGPCRIVSIFFHFFENINEYVYCMYFPHRHTPMYTCKCKVRTLYLQMSGDIWLENNTVYMFCSIILRCLVCAFLRLSFFEKSGGAQRTPERWSSWSWPRVVSWVNTWRRQGRWRKRKPKAWATLIILDILGCFFKKLDLAV